MLDGLLVEVLDDLLVKILDGLLVEMLESLPDDTAEARLENVLEDVFEDVLVMTLEDWSDDMLTGRLLLGKLTGVSLDILVDLEALMGPTVAEAMLED